MAQTLMTVQDVMDAGNLDNDALRPRIQLLLDSVFALAEQHCMRKFSSDTFTEYFDAHGYTNNLLLANPPLTSLLSVTDDAQYSARSIDTGANVLQIQEYKDEGKITLYNAEGSFGGGLAAVKIIYLGGWTASTFPRDLKQAICSEVLFRLNRDAVGVRQENVDGAGVSYDVVMGFARPVFETLERYRLHWKGIG